MAPSQRQKNKVCVFGGADEAAAAASQKSAAIGVSGHMEACKTSVVSPRAQ